MLLVLGLSFLEGHFMGVGHNLVSAELVLREPVVTTREGGWNIFSSHLTATIPK